MAAITKGNSKGLDAYLKSVQTLDGHGVKVGIQADTGNYIDSQASILDVAIYNEFGTETIPARPFIRTFAQKNEVALAAMMDRAADLAASGASVDKVLSQMGGQVQDLQQAHVRASKSWAVPNKASTVKAKGSSLPLVDHAVLVNAIRWEKT